MENLMMDFYDHPDFVRDLLNAIADYNIAQVKKAVSCDIDAVYFGDDWGQQQGLQMGPDTWCQFIYPVLKRMYAAVRDAGKYVFIHSCGDVDELFDDLVGIGLNCFNPFQPEVMDTEALLEQYRGRLAFHGGLSTQRTLPYGTVDDVRAETRRLIKLGKSGSYILSPPTPSRAMSRLRTCWRLSRRRSDSRTAYCAADSAGVSGPRMSVTSGEHRSPRP